MKTTASIPVVAALGLLALAPPSLAAPAKLSAGAVSASGATTVKVTNPNRYTLKGTVALASGKTKLASRKVVGEGQAQQEGVAEAVQGRPGRAEGQGQPAPRR